jgi:hypothetical protein
MRFKKPSASLQNHSFPSLRVAISNLRDSKRYNLCYPGFVYKKAPQSKPRSQFAAIHNWAACHGERLHESFSPS